jgi:acetate kinase
MGPLAQLGSKILVLNAGSSSLKFKLFDVNPFAAGIGGLIERIGDTVNSTLVAKHVQNDSTKKWNEKLPIPDHVVALEQIMSFLGDNVSKTINKDVLAVGHRVVHGLTIHKAVLLTDQVISTIREAATLAPLHNPPGLSGIEAAKKVFQSVPQVRPHLPLRGPPQPLLSCLKRCL